MFIFLRQYFAKFQAALLILQNRKSSFFIEHLFRKCQKKPFGFSNLRKSRSFLQTRQLVSLSTIYSPILGPFSPGNFFFIALKQAILRFYGNGEYCSFFQSGIFLSPFFYICLNLIMNQFFPN